MWHFFFHLILIFNFWEMDHPFPLDLFKSEWKVPASVQSFDLLGYDVFLGLDSNETKSLCMLSIFYIKCWEWGESDFLLQNSEAPLWGEKKRKCGVTLLPISFSRGENMYFLTWREHFMVIIIKSVKKLPSPFALSLGIYKKCPL